VKELLFIKVLSYALAGVIALIFSIRSYKRGKLKPGLFRLCAVVLGLYFVILAVCSIILEVVYFTNPNWHYILYIGLFVVGIVIRQWGTCRHEPNKGSTA